MALNVNPIYQHLYKILKTKSPDGNAKAAKAGATSISNQKMTTDEQNPSFNINQNLEQKKFDDERRNKNQQEIEVQERLKKLDIF